MFRRIALVTPVCLLALLSTGCPPSKAELEKSIVEEMKTKLNVDITVLDLQKQPDGSYVGTATAANGDTYDVTTTPPKGRETKWKAVASQAMIEKEMRRFVEDHWKVKMNELSLIKDAAGKYSGNGRLENGLKLKVSVTPDGEKLMYHAEPVE